LRRLNSLTDDELGQIDLILRRSLRGTPAPTVDEPVTDAKSNTIAMPQAARRRDRYGQ